MSAEIRWADSDGIWRRSERLPIVPNEVDLTWSFPFTDNGDGTWTSNAVTDNGDGTWTYP